MMEQNVNVEKTDNRKKGIDWYWVFTIILFVFCGLALAGIIVGLWYILEGRHK
jgi:hypothetical protein